MILTGVAGYFLQDLGLSINLKGPLAENAKLTLTDGNETHEIDLGYPSSDAAGEHAYWLIERLNTNHSKNASHMSYAVDQGSDRYKKKSFWYASSTGETLDALLQDAENLQNSNNRNYQSTPITWAKVDVNSSKVKFVYKNEAGNSGPVTLEVSNWKNIDIETPPEGNKLEFKRSWTALIPGIIGLVLIGLVLGAEKKPSIRMHVMHVAVLVGLAGFIMVSLKTVGAVSEMNWLKHEPNAIIQTSVLKPACMLTSAGLLLIFVILCIISFIQARKEMATTTPSPARKETKPQRKRPEDKDEKKTTTNESSNTKESKQKEDKKKPKVSNSKDDSSKPKRPDAPAQRIPRSPTKGLPVRKPMESAAKKDSIDSKIKTPSPSPKETGQAQDKKVENTSSQPKKEGEEASRRPEQKKDAEKGDDSAQRKDSAKGPDKPTTATPPSPSPSPKEDDQAQDKKVETTSSQPERDPEESKDSSENNPVDK